MRLNEPARFPETYHLSGQTPVLDIHSFGDTPVITFASSNRFNGDGFDSDAEYAKWRKRQHIYLASLSAISTRGKCPVVVPDTTHASMVMGGPGAVFLAKQINDFVSAGK